MRILSKQALYDDEGNRLSDCYDSIEKNPGDEFFVVRKQIAGKNLYNFLTEDGKELSKEWFADTRYFDKSSEAVWVQRVDRSTNLLKRDGTLILNHKKYTVVSSLCNGAAIVRNKEDKENFVNFEGKLISKIWFKEVYPWEKGGAIVEVSNNRYNYLKKDGTFLLDKALPRMTFFNDHFEAVYTDSKIWVISRPDFEIASEICCNVSKLTWDHNLLRLTNEHGETNILSDKTGRLIFDTWKVCIRHSDVQGYFEVAEKLEDKYVWYLYSTEGKKVTKQEFAYIGKYMNGNFHVRVMKDGKETKALFNLKNMKLKLIE